MVQPEEMKKYITVVGILGIIQVVLLTLVWLYFYRLGQNYPTEEQEQKVPSQVSEPIEKSSEDSST